MRFQAIFIMFLLLSIPFCLSDEVSTPGEQCYEKSTKGDGFIDIMDSGIVKSLETVYSVLWGISMLVNTIDYFITLVGVFLGHIGGTPGSNCCPIAIFDAGSECTANKATYDWWNGIKSSGWLAPLTALVTCACCSGNNNGKGGIMGGLEKVSGGAGGLCPLGDLANSLGELVDVQGQGSGISQFHLSAYDNIYLAAGCLCPSAILFNLRKLKTIYRVHNCCVEEACNNGQSLEVCSRQLDEALCMYWEGSLIKMLIKVVASIAATWIFSMFQEQIKELLAKPLVSCVFLAIDIVQVPARIQGLMGSFSWMQETFSEPTCSQLGFSDIEDRLKSGWDSQSAGVTYIMIDANGDGRLDTQITQEQQMEQARYNSGKAIAGIKKTGMAADVMDNQAKAIIDKELMSEISLLMDQRRPEDMDELKQMAGLWMSDGVDGPQKTFTTDIEGKQIGIDAQGKLMVKEGGTWSNLEKSDLKDNHLAAAIQNEIEIRLDPSTNMNAMQTLASGFLEEQESKLEGLMDFSKSKLDVDVSHAETIGENVVIYDKDGVAYVKENNAWVNVAASSMGEKEIKKAREVGILIERSKQQAAKEKEIKKKQEEAAEKARKDKMAYDAVWSLLDLALEGFAFPMADDMCKEDWDASEPANDQPQDTSGDGGYGAGYGPSQPCSGDTVTGQMRILNSSYEVSYTIEPCTTAPFEVYVKAQGRPKYTIDNGHAGRGNPITEHFTITYLPPGYTEICLEVNSDDYCFPAT